MDFEGEDTQDAFSGRTMDIELGGQEIITIDLDTLDEDPNDFIDLLTDAQCEIATWVKLTCEYLKKDLVAAADKIARKALQVFEGNGSAQSIPPTYYLLANIQLALARKAPKLILPNARRDDMSKEKPKEHYHESVVNFLRLARTNAQKCGMDPAEDRALLIRGIYQLATTALDDALSSFEAVLTNKPTNIVALLGKARVLFARRQFPQALKLFQQVLLLSPNCVPDPRIGIGLCFWQTNQRPKAKAAWERALEVNPKNWAASLLLGLEAINASKDQTLNEADRKASYFHGVKYMESTFRMNQKNASAANALFSQLLQKGDSKRAHKLAERAIQFADILAVVSSGHIHAGQLTQADGLTSEAIKHFNAALKGNPKSVLASIGLAQMQVQNDEIPAAIHTLDTLIQPPNPQKPLEALVMLASLRGNPRPGISTADAAIERQKARDLYDQVLKVLEGGTGDEQAQRRAQAIFGDDVDMFIEIARLSQDDNQDRLRSALNAAVRASEANGDTNPSLLNNLAVVKHLDGNYSEARSLYENALTLASSGVAGQTQTQIEAISTTILYNLSRAYEDQGEASLAKEAYEKLVSRHPEYIDAKVRLAHILVDLNYIDDAHDHLKQCLLSQKNNLNLRAAYSQFLIQRQLFKPAREFVISTLRDVDSHDVYALCAAGHIFFHEARENRDSGAKAAEDRRKGFLRAAEVFEKALQLDPTCAYAAQGLAIVAAEDVLDPSGGKSGVDVVARRLQSARDALDILGKVRESMGNSSVYVNMGHCYFIREEYDRAIDSYETAAKRSQDGYDLTILNNLCRAWYAKANKDQSYHAIKNALEYAQKALHIAPNEKVNFYNLAMIEQKGLEMLFAIQPTKRTLVDLKRAAEHGAHAQKLFASLAADRSSNVPYDRDVADQRRKYGDSLMRRVEDNLEAQRQYEDEQNAKVTAARMKRQEDKERLEALEREREEQLRVKAEHLAEERRKAREETQALMAAMAASSDEEKEKRPRKKKQQKAAAEEGAEAAGSGDEAGAGAAPPEPKKRRKGKLRKEGDKNGAVAAAEAGGEEEEALFSGEDEDRPAKKRVPKKRVVRDEDEGEAPEASSRPKKKQYKSKETISDSDEEMS